jgi:hypothetical protein
MPPLLTSGLGLVGLEEGLGDADAAFVEDLDLGGGGVLLASDDGARVAHVIEVAMNEDLHQVRFRVRRY